MTRPLGYTVAVGGGGGAVSSVAGKTGAVTLATFDIGGIPDGSALYPPSLPIPAPVAASSVVTASGWGGSAGVNTADTADFVVGTSSAKITSTGTGGTFRISKGSLNLDTTGKQLRVWLKCDDTTNIGSGGITVAIANDSGYAALFVPFNTTLTGLIVTVGTVGGTDLWIAALLNNSGTPVATSATAGTTAGTAQTKQKFTFATPVAVTGPAVYFAALQSNGTTARFRTHGNNLEGFVTGSVTGTFGTIPTIIPATTYTQSVGPHASTF